jgi:two-component system nitrogen regulation response regulator GlnG
LRKLLIVDDEPNVLYSLKTGLAAEGLQVVTARTARDGLRLAAAEAPDAAILDVRLPDLSGLEAFDRLRAQDPRLPVIIITAYSATEAAIEAMKRGAFEFLLKPVGLHHLRGVVARAVELRRMQSVPAVPDGVAHAADGDQIVGRSAAMQEVYKAIGRLAPQDVTVLITGESGTGKELVARAVYQHSKRATEPFLAINCAAIPDALLESELFGHEKGAFTGADRDRVGKFEQADGGTLFLDEVGDMSATAQAKVLRLLQEQRFERVGGRDPIRTDVRLIAATNQDLGALVAAGKFRRDLLYRLNGCTIRLPPLRDRRDDIPLLTDHFIRLANQKVGKGVRAAAPAALRILAAHSWPGNVRELQNVVRYAVIQAVGDVATADCLPEAYREPGGGGPASAPPDGLPDVAQLVRSLLARGGGDVYRRVQAEVERVVFGEVLGAVGGNQVHASELLGISRNTLRSRLQTPRVVD